MDDHISRQVILKHLEKCKGQPPEMCYTFAVLTAIESFVKSQPAADVAPVVYARWVKRFVNGKEKAVCTNCGKPNKQYTPPYCPHCGAIMDLREQVDEDEEDL